MRTSRLAEAVIARLENADGLDKLGEVLNRALGKAIPAGPIEDVLSGTPIGHPLHPAAVALPIGAWGSALVLDLSGQQTAARRLVGLGVLTAIPAAASGASDWLTTSGAERRVGLVHAMLNYGAMTAFGLSWFVRGHGRRSLGVALSLAGTASVSVAGWLGGHLSYAQGIGVDTTVFQAMPPEWTDLAALDDVPAEGTLGRVDLAGVALLVTRHRGDVVVLADRCTHRGAPLHEGTVEAGCVVCPWHDSKFDLSDGAVTSGPATRPQPALQTWIDNGRVLVRRPDPRTMGTRSVGP